MIDTPRLRLRPWRESDKPAFARLCADPEVMADLGGVIDRAASDAKLERYAAAYDRVGFGRLAIESREGEFMGYCGVMPSQTAHPLGDHVEIGWRLMRAAWGGGYASEAARAALSDAFVRACLDEVLAYTGPDNIRSQAVMARLGLRRDAARDFTASYDGSPDWRGLVWVARPA